MQHKIQIGLVDDHNLVRSGFQTIIGQWSNMSVLFESKDAVSVPRKLAAMPQLPDIILSDLQFPKVGDLHYSGRHLTRELREQFPSIKILVVTVQDDPVTMADLIQHGAHGFLSKSCSPRELQTAIQAIVEHGSYINETTLIALQNRLNQPNHSAISKGDRLSQREIEVLQLICQQLTAEEIGEKLFISAKTVNGHRNNLLQKTGARNITGLVMYAVKEGLVDVE